MSETSEKIRREWSINDAKRDRGLITPADIMRFDNIRYGEDAQWNRLDIYRPEGKKGRLPVIVVVHGGAWVYGDKELYQFYGMSLALRQFAVVNFSYRLAPEAKYPSSLEDLNQVILWMYENQDTYGLDMNGVFLAGDSSGAHLASLYGAVCTNSSYADEYGFQVPNQFRPKALGLNCGVYVPFAGEILMGEKDDRDVKEDLLPEGGSARELWLVNVLEHLTEAFPPVYLMTARGDFCRKQSFRMEEALKQNGIPYEFKEYGDWNTPLYHVFHLTMQEPLGRMCNDEECAFFRRFC